MSWSFNGETLTWGHIHQNVSMHSDFCDHICMYLLSVTSSKDKSETFLECEFICRMYIQQYHLNSLCVATIYNPSVFGHF